MIIMIEDDVSDKLGLFKIFFYFFIFFFFFF